MIKGSRKPLGELLMMGLPGPSLDEASRLLVSDCGVGNFILFSRNIENPVQVARLCDDLRNLCSDAGLPPPIIAVDQEGGTVQRLGPPHWKKIPPNAEACEQPDREKFVGLQASRAAEALLPLGIRLNLAPVLDLAGPRESGVLAGRSYGTDPRMTAHLGALYIRLLKKRGIAATAKHFPGIGRVSGDPHHERPVVAAAREVLVSELTPFVKAIQGEVQAVMTSHVIFPALDEESPTTFSKYISHDLLRTGLGFKGLLITDDLEMGGITAYTGTEEAAVRSFLAGHDLLLMCHTPERVAAALDALEGALGDGTISKTRMNRSLERLADMRDFCEQESAQC